ncbi:probable xyloglucan endotransglucosylase/hydrolase protein 30 [Phtheirospermum japonicum]|uniref:xyloglucan:xyloglucosyl transferase n=1 Tax=Phtheirospermum japonicum TaxID=374723 RepID=A0A830BQU7_9LAMI|nr:probable xyloglucan endotransglucosylase/hydrolase protein 30 [Phtheirospermum japonicum]
MKRDYPSKPMSVYATIWDASTWATNGGQEKVNYEYEPFVAEFKDLVLKGCIVDPTEQILSSNCTDSIAQLIAKDFATITPEGRESMRLFREKYMYYSYCYDSLRYPVPPPECVIVPSERDMFKESGRLKEKMKFHGRSSRHHRGRSRRRSKEAARG